MIRLQQTSERLLAAWANTWTDFTLTSVVWLKHTAKSLAAQTVADLAISSVT
jgi:hypothetical protein